VGSRQLPSLVARLLLDEHVHGWHFDGRLVMACMSAGASNGFGGAPSTFGLPNTFGQQQ
jgi:hypothetical protein